MSQIYRGLSLCIIQRNLNSMKEKQKVRPLFQNKVPLRSVTESKVQERHQEDLVTMASMPATIHDDTISTLCLLLTFSVDFLSHSLLKQRRQVSFAFHMYDAKSLDHCTLFDDQYMIVLYNFKTTSDIEHS